MSKNISFLQAAESYATESLAVFPIQQGSKKPLRHSNGFTDATVVNKTIKTWWPNNINPYNIAIATGMKSAVNQIWRLIVIDVDEKNGISGLKSLEVLEEKLGKLPLTRTVKTPTGGLHLYFYCKTEIKCAVSIVPGIDIRGDGGYIIAPPSRLAGFEHPYEFINDVPIAKLPENFSEYFYNHNFSKNKEYQKLDNHQEISEGSRNNTLFHYTNQLQRKGVTEEEALTLVMKKSDDYCNPPLPLNEIQQIVAGVYKRYFKKIPEFRIVNFESLLKEDLPSREFIIEPWLPMQGLAMIYAPRGIGKTHLALWIAYSIAVGKKFLGWDVPKSRRVLYLDGEMSVSAIKERCEEIRKANPSDLVDIPLKFLTPDLQPEGMPDISTKEGQQALEPYLTNIDLVIVDSISTLCRQGDENKAEDWLNVQEWALRLRALGKSVLFIHHAGKGGQQRGTSKREDVLDTVMALKNPAGFNPSEGASFEIHYEKSRGFCGADAIAKHVQLITDAMGNQQWAMATPEDSIYKKVIELHKKGLDQKEVAEELKKNKSTISRYLSRAKREGLLDDDQSSEF